MDQIIKQHPVIAILRNIADQDLTDYTKCLYEGGLRAFEISFSHPGADRQIKLLKSSMPSDTLIGAGTILTPADVQLAVSSGADFLLSPSTNTPVLSLCAEKHLKLLPGAFTPTDVSTCLEYGFETIKLFPAGDMPLSYRKSLNGPFPKAAFVAVGGISPQNTISYLKSGYVGVGIGSSLADPLLFTAKNWPAITESIHNFMNSLREENLL